MRGIQKGKLGATKNQLLEKKAYDCKSFSAKNLTILHFLL